MHRGRSEEEAALAGEECGSFWSDIKKAARITRKAIITPAGKVAAQVYLGPKYAAAAGLAAAMSAAGKGKSKKPKQEISRPTDKAAPAEMVAAKQTADVKAAVAGTFIGGVSTLNDRHIIDMIKRETNPAKRERMIINFTRAKAKR